MWNTFLVLAVVDDLVSLAANILSYVIELNLKVSQTWSVLPGMTQLWSAIHRWGKKSSFICLLQHDQNESVIYSFSSEHGSCLGIMFLKKWVLQINRCSIIRSYIWKVHCTSIASVKNVCSNTFLSFVYYCVFTRV